MATRYTSPEMKSPDDAAPHQGLARTEEDEGRGPAPAPEPAAPRLIPALEDMTAALGIDLGAPVALEQAFEQLGREQTRGLLLCAELRRFAAELERERAARGAAETRATDLARELEGAKARTRELLRGLEVRRRDLDAARARADDCERRLVDAERRVDRLVA